MAAAAEAVSPRITAFVTGDMVAVWTAEEATRLRVEHRVAGSPIGALAGHTQQNIVLGLPLVLSPEEVALLAARDAIDFVDLRVQAPPPSAEAAAAFSRNRAEYTKLQIERLKNNAGERQHAIDGVRKRRRVGPSPAAPLEPVAPSSDDAEATSGGSAVKSASAAGGGGGGALQQAVRIGIPTAGTYGDAALEALDHLPLLPEEIELPAHYMPERSDVLRARCRVMADLHGRGYWVTPGVKFGGDFLVYPGDPHRYHSHFVAVVVGWSQSVVPLDIVSFGRLGTVVKKALVLCSVGPDDEVQYVTAAWTGNVADADR